jgi:hypothetical protein
MMPSARDELLHAIFTTALEGGIGYWSSCSKYRWSTDGGQTVDYLSFHAEIHETEEDGEPQHCIDRQVVIRGYNRATSPEWRDRLRWSSGEKPPLVVTDDSDWDFDAGDADMIVQLGLFNEVRYG